MHIDVFRIETKRVGRAIKIIGDHTSQGQSTRPGRILRKRLHEISHDAIEIAPRKHRIALDICEPAALNHGLTVWNRGAEVRSGNNRIAIF